jgi:hypothetical protein
MLAEAGIEQAIRGRFDHRPEAHPPRGDVPAAFGGACNADSQPKKPHVASAIEHIDAAPRSAQCRTQIIFGSDRGREQNEVCQ